MCIAILLKAGNRIKKSHLSESFLSNPDGCGYAFCSNQKVIIRKPFFSFDKFYKLFSIDHKLHGKHSDFMIHFRITTSGVNDKTNTHPHRICENLVSCHNGILEGLGNKDHSDTVQFMNLLSSHNIGLNPATELLLDSYFMANHSKAIFLSPNKTFIAGASLGHWNTKKTIWYSNDSYLQSIHYNWGKKTKKDIIVTDYSKDNFLDDSFCPYCYSELSDSCYENNECSNCKVTLHKDYDHRNDYLLRCCGL